MISCKVSSKINSDFATFFEKSNGTETPDIKTSFEDKLKKDADFAKNPRVQLDFVFKIMMPAYVSIPMVRIYMFA